MKKHLSDLLTSKLVIAAFLFGFVVFAVVLVIPYARSSTYVRGQEVSEVLSKAVEAVTPKVLDTKEYDRLLLKNANYASTTGTSTPRLWPAKAPYPKYGAILPFNRIVAYYGNFYSKNMGVLGEYESPVVLDKLRREAAKWEAADPETPVVPAIEYIAVVAQDNPGKSGKYRARMPDDQIDKAIAMAKEVNGIVILDVQVGLSTVESEIPALEHYLSMPQVHLALDPEFSMKGGEEPGEVIGSLNANDINYVANYLAELVKKNDLPPKVLIVHRFTQRMVQNAEAITPLPEVQVVMVMDGWGSPARKIGTYKHFIYPEPVQFTGFKLFYKNDLKPPSERLLTPQELLNLTPQPLFIQYQ